MPRPAKRGLAPPADELVAKLRAIVGERGLLLGDAAAMRSCDPFRNVAPTGGIIVRPSNTREVSLVLELCTRHRRQVVTHGGCTGVAGGAYAVDGEINLSLERMNAIEEIDPIGQTATVQAGAPLEAVQDALAEEGLLYPIDLGSRGTATIGGTIATNAGGNRVLRWGMTRANILGLEAVLADGTIVDAMNRLIKNNSGYDVKQMLIGSEGTIGVVTRAVLKLVPAPSSQCVAFVAVPHFDALLALLQRARRMQILSAFEVMWRDYYDLMVASDSGRSPLRSGYPYYILIEAMGYDETADSIVFQAFLESALEDGLIADAVTAASGKQIADLWLVREGSEVIVREMSPFLAFDVSIDLRRVEIFVDSVKAALATAFENPRFVTFGHLGDNNIHLGVHVGADTVARELEIETIVYAMVRDFGGALTAEHGIGRFKRKFLPDHVSAGALDLMRRMRRAADPATLLNRDVLF